ncbi:MAG: ABC transporter ATP-binding protein [Tissierellia bacterium]|nr:ABC transporter ATP-binding protein [Tissierellia bacterium]
MTLLLDLQGVKKVYKTRFQSHEVVALRDINFRVEKGEYVAIMGESGSGKTTLLNILALLDDPTEGHINLNGRDIVGLKDSEKAIFRRNHLGYIFQDFNLLNTFNIKDNIMLPLVLADKKYEEMENTMMPIVNKLGIKKLLEKYPYELSGGEKQRTAIARALMTNPLLILADEPTGALDSRTTDELLEYFDLINQTGQTILMVTHSIKAASFAKRILFIKDGVIFHQLFSGNKNQQQMYEEISNTLAVLSRGDRID